MIKRVAQICAAAIVTLSLVACASQKKADSAVTKESAKATSSTNQKDAKKQKPAVSSSTPSSASEIKCSYNGDHRVLAITTNGQGGCELNYTKNGETKSLANSAANVSYCEEVQNRVKSNLVNAEFTCN